MTMLDESFGLLQSNANAALALNSKEMKLLLPTYLLPEQAAHYASS